MAEDLDRKRAAGPVRRCGEDHVPPDDEDHGAVHQEGPRPHVLFVGHYAEHNAELQRQSAARDGHDVYK